MRFRLLVLTAGLSTSSLMLLSTLGWYEKSAQAAGQEVVAGTGLVPQKDEVDSLGDLRRVSSSQDILAKNFSKKLQGGQVYPVPDLEKVQLFVSSRGSASLQSVPQLKTQFLNRVAGVSQKNDFVFYTLEPRLQEFAAALIKDSRAPHVAVVAMEPHTGKILAIAEKSNTIENLSLHAGFPAASLFKVVTAAAALERGVIKPDSKVYYRGGTYTLSNWNYRPDPRKDRRSMTVSEALGRSCNPVFGRIAYRFLDQKQLRTYAEAFGFNADLEFDAPLPESSADIPNDLFQLSRTAAGFGDVYISPVHAASLMSGVANDGVLPRPALIEKVITPSGNIKFSMQPEMLSRIVRPGTASQLLRMMHDTTTIGTSRREFMTKKNKPILPEIEVAAKTGTLRGSNPAGVNNWFIAAAPINHPKIAVSVIVINPAGVSSKASHIGRRLLEKFFEIK